MYEANVFPEDVGWERDGTLDADRLLHGGLLRIDVDLGIWEPLPFGENDAYRKFDIVKFIGEPFYTAWRCKTDAPNSEIEGTAGSGLNVGGQSVINHFTISEDRVRIWRGNSVPFVFVDVEPKVFHTYRIETRPDQTYTHYIDSEVVDEGDLLAPFPNSSARMIWWSGMYLTPNRNEWDYVRYGTIAADGSGDFDSDADVDLRDFRYFDECMAGSGPGIDAGPGCRWADMDGDDDVDFADYRAFQLAFTGGDDG